MILKGTLELLGNSIPEDAGSFYKPILDAVGDYFQSPQKKTTVNISLTYFNSSTSKWLMNLLRLFKTLPKGDQKVEINWYFDESDDDMNDAINDFSASLGLQINIFRTPKA